MLPLVVYQSVPSCPSARLRETSWKLQGNLLWSDPSSGTRPHLQCWDMTKHEEMPAPGEGRCLPHTGPQQQECVTQQGCHTGSAAQRVALWLYSVLARVLACHWGDMLFLLPGVALLSASHPLWVTEVSTVPCFHVVTSLYFGKIQKLVFKCFLAFYQLSWCLSFVTRETWR